MHPVTSRSCGDDFLRLGTLCTNIFANRCRPLDDAVSQSAQSLHFDFDFDFTNISELYRAAIKN